MRYILSFLQQGSPYWEERPSFVSKCQKGNGIGGPGSSDKWISNRVTARQCIEAVRSKYPTANGATIQNSCKKCRCWAEFGMTGWNRTDFNKRHFWGCKFNDKGKQISVILCIVPPLCDHCIVSVRFFLFLNLVSPCFQHVTQQNVPVKKKSAMEMSANVRMDIWRIQQF